VTQSNAASAEESAAAAEELNAQAGAMQGSVLALLRLVEGHRAVAVAGGRTDDEHATPQYVNRPKPRSPGVAMGGNGHGRPASAGAGDFSRISRRQ
jgi:hypothetical protein